MLKHLTLTPPLSFQRWNLLENFHSIFHYALTFQKHHIGGEGGMIWPSAFSYPIVPLLACSDASYYMHSFQSSFSKDDFLSV